MGELRLPGLATGIDTTLLIQQLLIIKGRRLASYQVKKADYKQQKTAFSELQSKVSALKTTVSTLSDSDNLEIFKTSASDKDILTLSASSDANPGSHSIEINRLATSETWIQDTSTFDYKTDYVGGGTFIYSYNHQERVITAVADETTLEYFVGLINNDADNPGVTASLLYQGGKYHLMLSGQETGEDYQISINTSSTEVWASSTAGGSFTKDNENSILTTKISNLDQFSGTLEDSDNAFITISGKNHFGTDISPDLDLTITANTTMGHLINAINKHFDGVATATLVNGEIHLTDHNSGTSSMEIGLSYDAGSGSTSLTLPTMAVSEEGGATSESLASLVSTSFIETQDAQSSQIKVDGYPSSTAAEIQTLTLDSVATGGHFHLSYMGQTTGEISYDAGTNDIQTALEALSTVSSGDITVGGTGLDQTGTTTFLFLSTAGDVNMISIDSSALTGPASSSIVETTQGNDGWIRRNSNSISDALTGVTLNLHDVTETDTSIEITVQRNTQAITKKITNMMTAYNELTSYLKQQTEYNNETKEMGILSTNFGISFIKSQIRNPFFGIAGGFDNDTDSFLQASDIGLTVDHNGVMELDQSELKDAINENFMDVIYLLGAAGIGDSDSNTIDFYGSSKTYTTGGTYDVDITISGGTVTIALIKLSSESTWRNAIWSGNGSLISGDSTFDNNGDPLYPENSLQLTVDLSTDGNFTATVRVKQGVAGALEDTLQEIIEADGRLDVGVDFIENRITALESRIRGEESRLEDEEDRLVAKFARMERTLIALQQQMSAVTILTQYTLGSFA